MKVARLMSVVELEKFDKGEEIRSYGKYYGKSINNMADICSSPQVTFFDPQNTGSCELVSGMFIPGSTKLRVFVLFEMDDMFIRGCGEGRYEELYVPSYSRRTARKLWQSEPFIEASSSGLNKGLRHLHGGPHNMSRSEENELNKVRIIFREEAVKLARSQVERFADPDSFTRACCTDEEIARNLARAESTLKFLEKDDKPSYKRSKIDEMLLGCSC